MKAMRRLVGALATLLWLARLQAAEPTTDQPVSEFSDVMRLAFTGNKAFSEAAIRDGLLMKDRKSVV